MRMSRAKKKEGISTNEVVLKHFFFSLKVIGINIEDKDAVVTSKSGKLKSVRLFSELPLFVFECSFFFDFFLTFSLFFSSEDLMKGVDQRFSETSQIQGVALPVITGKK